MRANVLALGTVLAVEHAAVFRQKPRSIWVALMASRRSAASPK
jgi:hypothetical protein